jgi:hypothetical protein
LIRKRDPIDLIAGRIELAYRRRHPDWLGISLAPGVWESAATRLVEASRSYPGTPIDPELYVAALISAIPNPDPWSELTRKQSVARYIRVLRRIVSQLRREVAGELRRADRMLEAGQKIDDVLEGREGKLSPFSRYILAFRAGRMDLIEKHRASAESQHRSCPLYREAIRPFLPGREYPGQACPYELASLGPDYAHFSLN